MTKSISCKDAGKDCGWSATAETETEEELMAITTEHVKESHKELQVNSELGENIKSLIKDI